MSEIKKQLVSAVVPIFNEEKTVAGIIEALSKSPLIDEVVCVNDGSRDKSLTITQGFKDKIKLIDLKKNCGKGFALAEGIKKASGEIVAFFDADLTNLSDNYIQNLLEPILEGKAKAVLGCPTKRWFLPNMFSQLTGERAYYKKGLIPHLEEMAKTRFGVEIFLNDLFDEKETKKVPLKHLSGLYKYEKRNSSDAFKEYLTEVVEIAQAISQREDLLPADKQIIARLAEVTDHGELKKKIKEIYNKPIRQFLEKYILKYIKNARQWWKNF